MVWSCTFTRDVDELTAGCPDGTKFCGGSCVSLTDPAYGCGDTCEPCPMANGVVALACQDGACVATQCAATYKLCSEGCESRTDPKFGCDRPACDPCVLTNTTAALCDAFGRCEVGTCVTGYSDCNLEPLDGCEVFVREDVANCGRCGNACPTVPNAEVACGAGSCSIRRCTSASFKNCDNRTDNGCETNVRESALHCGNCNAPCEATQTCVDGLCQ